MTFSEIQIMEIVIAICPQRSEVTILYKIIVKIRGSYY